MFRFLSISSASALLLGLSCAHRPGDLTAAEHRNEAAIHHAKANQELSKYEPASRRERPGPFANEMTTNLWEFDAPEPHLAAADRHRRQAHEHLKAAQTLEVFEDRACEGLSTEQRAACPLITPSLSSVQELEHGVRLLFKPTAPTELLIKEMRCHLAYAKAQGFEHPSCPLYLKGVELKANAHGVDVVSANSQQAQEIRSEAKVMFGRDVAPALP